MNPRQSGVWMRGVGIGWKLVGAILLAVCLASPEVCADEGRRPRDLSGLTLKSGAAVRYRLQNGLSVVLQPGIGRGRVAVLVQYAVGAMDDPPGYSGLAHLVEHLTYRGSRHLAPLQAFSALERVGATSINGTTSQLRTTYQAAVPSSGLETALWIESERMAFTLEKLDATHFELERRIVWNEARQRRRAGGEFGEHVLRALLPDGHPYRPRPIDVSDLDAIRLQDAQWFMQRWYRPNNATLIVLGDFQMDRARYWVDRYFGPIVSSGSAPPARTVPMVSLSRVRRVQVAAPVLYEAMTFLWPVRNGGPRQRVALDVGLFLLEERLKLALVRTNLARSVSAFASEWHPMSFDEIAVQPEDGVTPDQVEDAVHATLREVHERAPSKRDLSEARAWLLGQGVFAAEDLVVRALSQAPRAVPLEDLLRLTYEAQDDAVIAELRKTMPLDRHLVAFLSSSRYAAFDGEVVRPWRPE